MPRDLLRSMFCLSFVNINLQTIKKSKETKINKNKNSGQNKQQFYFPKNNVKKSIGSKLRLSVDK